MKFDAGRSLPEPLNPGWFCNVASVPDCKELTWDWLRWWYLSSIECLRDIVNLPISIYKRDWYFCVVNPWKNLYRGSWHFCEVLLDCCPRSLLSNTFNQTIKTLLSNSKDTPDIPLSNSEIKNESIFIIPFLIDFYTFSVTVDTKKGGNVSPLSITLRTESLRFRS